MDKFEEQKLKKESKNVKNGWFDWLINYSKAYKETETANDL